MLQFRRVFQPLKRAKIFSHMRQSRLISEIDDLISDLENLDYKSESSKPFFAPPPPVSIKLGMEPQQPNKAPTKPPSQGRKRQFGDVVNVFEQSQSEAKKPRPMLNSSFDLQHEAKAEFADMLIQACKSTYGEQSCQKMQKDMLIKFMRKPRLGQAHIALNLFSISKLLDVKPFIPKEIGDKIVSFLEGKYPNEVFQNIESVLQSEKNERGPSFLNLTLCPAFLAQIIDKILDKNNSFVGPLAKLESERENVMIEYSQPNTHKAFHVGHMRNCAIGDCITRLYEHMGHKVIPVNYFGDEGAHIAKCLWLLKKLIKEEGLKLNDIPVDERGSWLGELYTRANKMVSLSTYTIFPERTLIIAQVKEIQPHPNDEKLKVVTVDFGKGTSKVVCGGTDYQVGDKIVYCPLGGIYKGKEAVEKDIRGVVSRGVIMGALEMGVTLDKLKSTHQRFGFIVRPLTIPENPKEEPEVEAGGKKKKKKKKKKSKAPAVKDSRILILPKVAKIGQSIIEFGRIPPLPKDLWANLKKDVEDKDYKKTMRMCSVQRKYLLPELILPEGSDVEMAILQRNVDYRQVLHHIESENPEYTEIWEITKQWSFDMFKEIYSWLGCRFDHDFTESECSKLSQAIVDEYYEKGVLVESDGCLGANLGKKLGFCMLRKSDGCGLYATKDLALARIKFDQFKVDKSFYVTDAGQSLHFSQVFATLKLMGFKQAEKCVHIPYGKVNGPGGVKMSSRDGNIILFNDLRTKLRNALMQEFVSKLNVDENTRAEILHHCSVGTIRYGMLNHDFGKDIAFDIKKWTSIQGGDTGPYIMMQYTRVKSIQRKVTPDPTAVADLSLLNGEDTQGLLLTLSEFQNVVKRAAGEGKGELPNPSCLCTYLFNLSKDFSKWYTNNNIKNNPDKNSQLTQLLFCQGIAAVLKRGLELLGMRTLERM